MYHKDTDNVQALQLCMRLMKDARNDEDYIRATQQLIITARHCNDKEIEQALVNEQAWDTILEAILDNKENS